MKQRLYSKCDAEIIDLKSLIIQHETSRTDDSMKVAQLTAQESADNELSCITLSYHAEELFTIEYLYNNDIINAMGSDLLHQIFKYFKDYLLNK